MKRTFKSKTPYLTSSQKESIQKGLTPLLQVRGLANQRNLSLLISDDMPELKKRLSELFAVNRPGARIMQLEHVSSQIAWRKTNDSGNSDNATAEGDSEFGFRLQFLQSGDLLHAASGSLEEPILFPDGKLTYFVENTPAPPCPLPADWATGQAAAKRRIVMWISSGENALFEKVTQLLKEGREDDCVQMKTLNTGDISWTCDGLQFGLVVERKKNSDFVATIQDSARHLQLAMMLDVAPTPQQVMYLVEGDVMNVESGVNPLSRVASLTLPVIRHGVRVASVPNTEASARFLCNLHMQMETCAEEKLLAHKFYFGKELNSGPRKKDYTGVGGKDQLVRVLTVVDGVSNEMAAEISGSPKIMGSFANLLMLLKAGGPNVMSEWKYTPATGAGARRLGVISEKIYNHFEIFKLK
jgi:ERCC4-type nuclease